MEHFRPYSESILKTLITFQRDHLDKDDDSAVTLMFSVWQRFCKTMKREFAPYLVELMPELFKITTLNPLTKSNGNGEDEKEYSVESQKSEERLIGIKMLSAFIEELKELYVPYVEETSVLFISLLEFNNDDSIRSCIAD